MRKHYIEYLRVIAMFAVVAIHVCIAGLSSFANHSMFDAVFYSSVRNIFHFAVPVFFMISGALMLSPSKDLPIKKLLRRYLLKYGLVILVFGWGFAAIERYFVSHTVSVDLVTGSFVDMLTGKSWDHMWYMYALFGTMLAVPILRLITAHCTRNSVTYFVIIFSLFLSVIPLAEYYFRIKLGVTLPFNSIYCFYMLLGYWIDSGDIFISKKLSVLLMALLFPVIVGLTILQQVCQWDTELLFAYFSPLVGMLSVGIFSFFRNMETTLYEKPTPRWILFCGKYSFAYISYICFGSILPINY